jgi:hypothetical protein
MSMFDPFHPEVERDTAFTTASRIAAATGVDDA